MKKSNKNKLQRTLFLSEAERRRNHVDYYQLSGWETDFGTSGGVQKKNLLHISNEIDDVTFLTNEKRKTH